MLEAALTPKTCVGTAAPVVVGYYMVDPQNGREFEGWEPTSPCGECVYIMYFPTQTHPAKIVLFEMWSTLLLCSICFMLTMLTGIHRTLSAALDRN